MNTIWLGVVEKHTDAPSGVDASCTFAACTTREKLARTLAETAVQISASISASRVASIELCSDLYSAVYDSIMTAGYVENDDLPVTMEYSFYAYELNLS